MSKRSPSRPQVTTLIWVTAVTLVVSACMMGRGARSNGLIHVVNLGPTDASIEWQDPGPVTPKGAEPITPCRDYVRGFNPGDEQIVITSATDTQSFTLSAPVTRQTVAWFVIAADGRIARTTEAAFPKDPCPSDHGPS